MLNGVARKKLYEYVVDEIGIRIINGVYPPGTSLPNEDGLCQEFGVSRGVLREATKVLAQKGLIEPRPKIGTQVQSKSNWNLFDADVLIWKLKSGEGMAFLRNVTEVRRIIESEAARFAAERAEPDEIAKIQCHCQEMVSFLNDDTHYEYETYLQLDMAFHLSILDACHNDLLSQIGYTMRQAIHAARQLDTRDIQSQRESLPDHVAIFEAIARHDVEAAYNASQNMFRQVWHQLPHVSK